MLSMLIFGLSNSMQLAIIAVGFSLVLSIAGIANFAYGSFYLLGAFIVWALLDMAGLPYWACILISLVAIFLLGVLTYRYAIQRIRGAVLSEVIVTIGLGVFITEIIRSTGLIGTYKYMPSLIPGHISILGVGIENQRLIIIPLGLALFGLLWLFTKYTKVGLAFRAMSQDELTALSIGLNNNNLAMLAMGISSVVAVIAALAIIPQGTLIVDASYDVLTYALSIAVLGGLGSTTGIIVGALILGYAQSITATYISPQWTMVVTFLIIVVVLLTKPSGIFGQQKQLEERV
jgi:branched-chain amino acid transport system permease protein